MVDEGVVVVDVEVEEKNAKLTKRGLKDE